MNLTKQSKQEFWKHHIVRASRRAIGARAYCRDNDLDPLQFYYWRTKLRREVARSTAEVSMPKFVAAVVAPSIEVQTVAAVLLDAEWVGRFAVELIRGLSR